jgi:hypothetical protein
MKRETTEVLKCFYIAYLYWAERPYLNSPIFVKNAGLCLNLCNYMNYHGDLNKIQVKMEMRSAFIDAGMSPALPFNPPGMPYNKECITHSCHLNEARLNWVRAHAK